MGIASCNKVTQVYVTDDSPISCRIISTGSNLRLSSNNRLNRIQKALPQIPEMKDAIIKIFQRVILTSGGVHINYKMSG